MGDFRGDGAARMQPSMARPTTPATPADTLLTPRIAALAKALPSAIDGEPTAVHRARVASRRLREVLPVLDLDARRARRRARVGARRVTRKLGPVRELDVAAGHLEEILAQHPVGLAAQTTARQALAAERAAALASARAALTPARLTKLWASLEQVSRSALSAEPGQVGEALASRVARRGEILREAVDRVGVLYVPERLHAVRIAVKRLRYSLEAAGDARRSRGSAQLKQLRAIQELLGQAHDLHVLAGRLLHVQRDVVTQSRTTARDLGHLAREIDRACRELHGSFMGRRAGLLALAGSLAAPRALPAARSVA